MTVTFTDELTAAIDDHFVNQRRARYPQAVRLLELADELHQLDIDLEAMTDDLDDRSLFAPRDLTRERELATTLARLNVLHAEARLLGAVDDGTGHTFSEWPDHLWVASLPVVKNVRAAA